MTALTVRLADDKYRCLKEVAQQLGTSVNRLIDEMATFHLNRNEHFIHYKTGRIYLLQIARHCVMDVAPHH